MRIETTFRCIDIPIGLGNGELIINEGTTIEEAVKYCKEKYDIQIPIKELLTSLFLVNSTPASPSYILKENDKLSIVRLLGGG